MKRTLLLAVLFVALGLGAWYAWHQKNAQTGTTTAWDMDFAIKDQNDIGKIFIADRKGNTATLERQKDGSWRYNGQYPARATSVKTLLETVTKLTVKALPITAAEGPMIKSLATEGIKVEIYGTGGERLKCYYVGGVTNDEHGTYMMMEGSEHPFVTHIPSFIGQLRVRYLLGDANWRDRTVFAIQPETIQSIAVEYPQQKSESFRLEKVKEAEYTVTPYFSTTTRKPGEPRKGIPEAYLLKFESLVAEGFENNPSLQDSVSRLVPFAIITVKKIDGREQKVQFWPTEVGINPSTGKAMVERYFVVNGNDFLSVQDFVFGPIFR
ncbi:MAG: DUF4340 domain-containing protein, partial [Saprospiraceae bacterium]